MTTAKTPSLPEYKEMFDSMSVNPVHNAEIAAAIQQIKNNQKRYQGICDEVNPKIPWYSIGIVHYMECDCSFKEHIHNGDPLSARTVQVPAGRPIAGEPPFTWEESCIDWLNLKKWNKWQDWEPEDILARFELNNGLGYRDYGIPTPYLWSYTNLYISGKYVSDNHFNSDAVSKEVGAAVLLKAFV